MIHKANLAIHRAAAEATIRRDQLDILHLVWDLLDLAGNLTP